jgi:hypothetical protein
MTNDQCGLPPEPGVSPGLAMAQTQNALAVEARLFASLWDDAARPESSTQGTFLRRVAGFVGLRYPSSYAVSKNVAAVG